MKIGVSRDKVNQNHRRIPAKELFCFGGYKLNGENFTKNKLLLRILS